MKSFWGLRDRIAERLLLPLLIRRGEVVPIESDMPLPPSFLMQWVAGTNEADWFIESGKLGKQTILTIFSKYQIRFDEFHSILDFGCGCGRDIRHLAGYTSVQMHGCDINRAAISWCDKNLNFGEFCTNSLAPPTRYRNGAFDLVYAFSVSTHLEEPLQTSWMREMHRI